MKDHGTWQIKKTGNLIFSEISGIWNEEATRAYFDHYKKLKYDGGFYAEICSILNWELSTPEAIGLITQIEKWHRDNGRKYLAMIANDNAISKKVSRNVISQYELPEDFEIKYFTDVQSGFDWISEKGFDISREEISFFKKTI